MMVSTNNEKYSLIADGISGLSMADALHFLSNNFPNEVTFSTSFSMEDQIITHCIFDNKINIKIFTLDTGRLFEETYAVWQKTIAEYSAEIVSFSPNAAEVEALVQSDGPNLFYQSVDKRKKCCGVRKVEPLKRALAGKAVWITGLRASQSVQRSTTPKVEWDEINGIIKFHPILHFSSEMVIDYIKKYDVPYNSLHDKGFVSIGCAPCTRAISEGEDFRAGRWWWEDAEKKECGLHAR